MCVFELDTELEVMGECWIWAAGGGDEPGDEARALLVEEPADG